MNDLANFICLWIMLFTQRCQNERVDSKRIIKQRTARIEGDIVLGALFPVHYAPPNASVFSRACGPIRELYGIQRIETLLFTLDKINMNDSILPNITLGCDIRDSCWYSAIALEQSIDFIKDAIASNTELNNNQSHNKGCSAERLEPIAGLVGPGSSESTIQVQNLLQIFHIPQIGYSATSISLSDKSRFNYFLRVVPPDNYQAQALIDIVVRFNWTYISTVYSDGNYGERGIQEFEVRAQKHNVCIAESTNIASSADEIAFDKVIDQLEITPNATVVVCFCEGMTVHKLLLAAKRKNVVHKYVFIGSDGWGNRPDVVEGVEEEAAGGISIKLYSPQLDDFDDYYSSLYPENNSRNPWFKEFWQERFVCRLNAGDDTDTRYNEMCSADSNLANSKQDSKLGFVANAVYTMAYALHNMHQQLCDGKPGLCDAMRPINGSLYLDYLLNVTFNSYSGEAVHFDDHGNPPGRYEIVNYQPQYHPDGNVTYTYVSVGTWMTGTLSLNSSKIHWPGSENTDRREPESICSKPCPKGHVKEVKGSSCCWVCIPCKDNQIVTDNSTCTPCDLGWWPNFNLSECEEIPIEFTSWHDSEAIVAMTMACVSILVTCWIGSVFIRHNNTPVVKASTRELSYIILFGIIVACCSNFVIVAKPSIVTCYLSRILPGLAFSLMYGALVTKTNRIARILEGSKKIMTKKPRFMSASAQVVITGIIIGVESAIITIMLIIEPADSKFDYPAPKRVRLVCNTTTLGVIVPLGFDLLLIFMCTLYAIKTRNLPENFNEAKFIGFTMYTTCVIWSGFFPIYFGGESKSVTMCISITLSAVVTLVLLFCPKVYIIIWAPEKNTRGAFTTSKDVRCHIGSKSMPSADSLEYKDLRYDGYFKSDISRPRDKWKNKSLDEKSLKSVMKRTCFPESKETPYVNHHLISNQRPSPILELEPNSTPKKPGRFSSEAANRKSVEEDIAEFCEQFPEYEEKETSLCERPNRYSNKPMKDSQCQTDYNVFMTLEPTCRRRIRSPYTSPISKRCPRIIQNPPAQAQHDFLPTNSHSKSNRSSNNSDQIRSRDPSTPETYPLLDWEDEISPKEADKTFSDSHEFDDMYTLECSISPSHCSKDGNYKSKYHKKSSNGSSVCEPLVLHNAYAKSKDSLLNKDLSPTREKARRYFDSVNTNSPNRSGCGISHSSVSSGASLDNLTDERYNISLSALENEEKGVADFQEYLQKRGLQLDMSSVQTSDL
ncbi:metabotropic glutamate receptor 5 [Patella vulgata]|uniref:metabotropic glutamate receptor 5 n=1 Tax=Patella vulgata TaxID=6465 RepID=UPI0024A93971|nr:metabotropic glutamate receptor 5 [Patella vulgata]